MRILVETIERMQSSKSNNTLLELQKFLISSIFLRYPLLNVQGNSFDGTDANSDEYFKETARMFACLLTRHKLMQDYSWRWAICLVNTRDKSSHVLWCIQMFWEHTSNDFMKIYGKKQIKKLADITMRKVLRLLDDDSNASEIRTPCHNIKRLIEETKFT
jgi:hypothetical protein